MFAKNSITSKNTIESQTQTRGGRINNKHFIAITNVAIRK